MVHDPIRRHTPLCLTDDRVKGDRRIDGKGREGLDQRVEIRECAWPGGKPGLTPKIEGRRQRLGVVREDATERVLLVAGK